MKNDLNVLLNKYLTSEDRIKHSVRVADTAKLLAKKHNIDQDTAYTAGILHDIAKDVNLEKAIQIARKYDYTLTESEIFNKKLLHAPIGALIIKNELNITDPQIINAVRWHTTGREQMDELEKIIYLADLIEPGRKDQKVKEIYKISFENLNKAMFMAVVYSLKKLIENKQSIDQKSIDCYNFYLKLN